MSSPPGVHASQVYEFLMESQFWPEAQMKAYQQGQLSQLLRHAKANVPFYSERLNRIFKSDGSIDWARWGELPILKREDVAQHFDAMQASVLPAGHGPTAVVSTSGSTGLPIRIRNPYIMQAVGLANDWRAHRWWNVDWSAAMVDWFGDLPDGWQADAARDRGIWGSHSDPSAAAGKSYVFDQNAPIQQRLDHLRAVNAKYLYAQANHPYAAALEMSKGSLFHKLDAVMTLGMKNEPEYHEAVATSFGAKMRGRYSSTEAGRIGYTCETGGHYHVCSETVVIEILDDHDQPCGLGQTGRIIVTPFLATPQPFIRYEQGDLGAWGEPCICGKRLPVIKEVSGRIEHLFKRADGTKFGPAVFDSLRPTLGAEFWQFVQIGINEIEVRYKPTHQRDLTKEQFFIHLLRKELKQDYVIKFSIVDKLPLTPAGKFIKYLNAIKK